MSEKILPFDNNEGRGGFERGAYSRDAHYPIDANWTRQSRFSIPDQPHLIWKVRRNKAIIDGANVAGAIVVDKDRNAIISDRDNTIFGPFFGRIIQVKPSGETKELFKINMRLQSPILGEDGLMYLTTIGDTDSTGHKLYCLFPDGRVKWEFLIDNNAHSKPVIDVSGNVYMFTYGNDIGTLFSIRNDGILYWERKFKSINWYEPIISKDGVIYIGLNVNRTLCAFAKNGEKLWERRLGQGWGSYPFVIRNDGMIYACLSSALYALNPDGSTKWVFKPKEGNVATSPAIDREGNLYVNLSAFRLISLDSDGKDRWETTVQGAALVPPIIGNCHKFYQQSFMQYYPQYKSWIEAYSNNGEKIWKYDLNGTIISTALADDNLIYALSNCRTEHEDDWRGILDLKWELHAIGDANSIR
jgi:outer membrane protein assembly factor BamB